MTHVHISDGNHAVTLEHDGSDLAYVVEKTQQLWEDTRAPLSSPGPATGFSSQIADQWDHDRRRPVRAERQAP
jgi:hypothetical protein